MKNLDTNSILEKRSSKKIQFINLDDNPRLYKNKVKEVAGEVGVIAMEEFQANSFLYREHLKAGLIERHPNLILDPEFRVLVGPRPKKLFNCISWALQDSETLWDPAKINNEASLLSLGHPPIPDDAKLVPISTMFAILKTKGYEPTRDPKFVASEQRIGFVEKEGSVFLGMLQLDSLRWSAKWGLHAATSFTEGSLSHKKIHYFKRSIQHPEHRNPWDMVRQLQNQVIREGKAGAMDLVK
jgi:hypothetical protein